MPGIRAYDVEQDDRALRETPEVNPVRGGRGGTMKAGRLAAFAASFALTMPVLAQAQAPSLPQGVSGAELKWIDLDPSGAPGVKIADVWGDHTKGAFGAFIKLPAGFAAPLHTHTNDFKIVIVSGTFIQGPEGKPEFRLGPSSFLMQPGGAYRHTTGCDAASDCVFYAESAGGFDLKT